MKIIEIKCYQSVRFCTKQETHFSVAKTGMEDLKISIQPELLSVLLTMGSESILVPFTNVAYMIPVTEPGKPKSAK